MKWKILKAEIEEFQALNTDGIGYILKLERKLFGIIPITKRCTSILPYDFDPEPGKYLNS